MNRKAFQANKQKIHNMGEIQSSNKGKANWKIEIYKPEGTQFSKMGYLNVTKELTQIFSDSSFSVPLLIIASQNVAYIERLVEEED